MILIKCNSLFFIFSVSVLHDGYSLPNSIDCFKRRLDSNPLFGNVSFLLHPLIEFFIQLSEFSVLEFFFHIIHIFLVFSYLVLFSSGINYLCLLLLVADRNS